MSQEVPSNLLARVNFPLYMVQRVSERHILVAGGGGSAKTGISNSVEVYELSLDTSCHNGCTACRVMHQDTGSRAFMNGTVFENEGKKYLAAGGIDGYCQIQELRPTIANGTNHVMNGTIVNKSNGHAVGSESSKRDRNHSGHNNSNSTLRRRTSSTSSYTEIREHVTRTMSNGSAGRSSPLDNHHQQHNNDSSQQQPQHHHHHPHVSFEMGSAISFQADFKINQNEEPFLKVVRFNAPSNILVTGGSDGHFRVWKFPSLTQVLDVTAHQDEIDDMDLDVSAQHTVTVSRDGHGYLWKTKNGSKVFELKSQLLNFQRNDTKIKYKFRSCRFHPVEGENSHILFTSLVPVGWSKPPDPCYLCKWDMRKCTLEKKVAAGLDILTNMTISDDGRFLGVGSMTGAVSVYISFSLQKLYHVENSHRSFVTGVEFLKCCQETQRLTGDNDVSLVSISVDNKIVLHHIPKQDTIGFLGSSFLFMLTLLIVYILMDIFGL